MIEDQEQTNPRVPIAPEHESAGAVVDKTSEASSEEKTPATPEATPDPAPQDISGPIPENPPIADATEQEVEPVEVEKDVSATTIQVPVSRIIEPDLSIEVASLPSRPSTVAPSVSVQPPVPALPYMTADDVLALQLASDPQVSPDGTTIAFTLQYNDAVRDTTGSAIWLVNSGGGKGNVPYRLTNGTAHDTQPRWSPDGKTLAFISNRSGLPQLYLLPLAGGEARQVSNLPYGITAYSWHPGGQMLLAHSYWKPGDELDEDDALVSDKVLATVYTRLARQYEPISTHDRYLQLWLVPLEGKVTRLTSEPVDLLHSCWSPDGTEIVFCANRRPDPDLSASQALWVLTLATGQLRRLTPEEGKAQMPAWSPDGQTIAYLYATDETAAGNIMPYLVPARGDSAPRPAVAGVEQFTCQSWIIDELRTEWVVRPQWYPDSQALLVPVQERGQIHLYRLERTQNTARRLTSGNGRYFSPRLSRDGQLIAFIRADWFTPGDIWCMDGAGQNLRKLTRVNDAVLQSHQLVRPKRISWQSFDGLTIEGWLYLPPQAGSARVPMILAPHGGPSLAWGDSYVHEFQVLVGQGYAVLAPNPRGSAGYGDEFSRKSLNDWGGDDWRDLLAGLDHVIATEPIDGQRLGINGLSYGAYLTNWALTQTTRFKAAVSRNGFSSLETVPLLSSHTHWFAISMTDEQRRRERSPLNLVQQIRTPLLLLHSDQDFNCPFSEALQLFVALRKRKQTVELVRYHDTYHLLDWPGVGSPRQRVDRLNRTLAWFRRFLY